MDQAIAPKENVMANRLFSAAMSFYCSLMLSSAFVSAGQGLNFAGMGGGVPAPAAQAPSARLQPAAIQKPEPLKELAQKIRKEGKEAAIGPDQAVFFGLAPADKPAAIPARYQDRSDDGVVRVVLVTEKLQIMYFIDDRTDPNRQVVSAYMTDTSGKLAKAGRSVNNGPAEVLAGPEADASFGKEVAYWRAVSGAAVVARKTDEEKKD